MERSMRDFRGLAPVILAALAVGCAARPRPEPRVANGDPGVFYRQSAGVVRRPVASPVFRDSGPSIRREMLDLIRGARHSVLVDSFLLNEGPASREVLDALVEKVRQGVDVRVLGDASSRFVKEEEAFTYLSERGVPTAEFNPVRGWRLFVPHVLLERDHRKFWIIDGRRVYLGGANLSDLSLIPPEQGGNRDLMVGFESPEVAGELTRSFVSTWNESRASQPLSIEALAPERFRGTVKGPGYWVFNQDCVPEHPSPTEVMFDGLFASAARSVWLVEPYTFTNREILRSIREMSARGVEVNLVLSSQVRAPRFRYASFYGILDLIDAGARVWVFDSEVSPLHYKCAVVDGRLAFVGSANFNHRSFRLSRELNVVFDDPASVKAVERVVMSVREKCHEVTRDEAVRYRGMPFAAWWFIMQTAG
jgi:cardiolipin synthase